MNASFEQVAEQISRAEYIVLATHINPDGDALGSMLGLAEILEASGRKVLRYLEEPVPQIYRFLPGCGQVQTDMDRVREFSREAGNACVVVCLDCGDKERLGKSGPALMKIRPFLVIDHHRGNGGFGDVFWIEPERSSTGEMVFDLVEQLGYHISVKAAECLFAAIVTDTGSFKYESTSSHTFHVAQELVRYGARPDTISENLYDNYSLGRLRLMQEVLATLEMYFKDKIAVIRVTQRMLERTFTTMEDTENFINLPRSVRTTRVAVFLKEVDDNTVGVSMRAKGECDVSVVAAIFGGGGHRNASGFRMTGKSVEQVRDLLLSALEKEMSSK